MNPFARVRAAFLLVAASLLSFAGCGGGSDSNSSTQATTPPVAVNGCAGDCGQVWVGLTDADGDFLSYTVDVVSLTLKRADGAVAEALPNRTRVDFAQYVDLTEFLTAASVPLGSYVEGTLRLDFTHASITVERNGAPVAATVVDAAGNPLGVVDVRVVLDNRHRLVVAPGVPALLSLDFNLAATNTVDLTTTPVRVTARPTLIASLEPVREKEMRLRGPLVSVDVAAGTYVVDLRPFHHPHARHGRVTVHTTSTTAFEINGQSQTGSAGLQLLSDVGAGTMTAAFGALNTQTRTFTAERVHAGTSVPGQGVDTVIGTILSRSGNELIVRGGTIVRALEPNATTTNSSDNHATFFRGDIKVVVGSGTVVIKDGFGVQATGAQALSVGQLIHAYGRAAQVGDQYVVDATRGRVRMHHTHIFGTMIGNSTGAITLNLAAINGRRIDAFDFTGTGATPAQDADPANYEVRIPPFTITPMVIGRHIRAIGFVTPFGAAPPDFEARTLVSYVELRSQLAIGWGSEGTATPFSSADANGLVLDLTNPDIGLRHHIHLGPVAIDLNSLSTSPTIAGATSGTTMYAIVTASGIMHYSDFAEFVTALTAQLTGSTRILSFTAGGTYDPIAISFTASEAVAILR